MVDRVHRLAQYRLWTGTLLLVFLLCGSSAVRGAYQAIGMEELRRRAEGGDARSQALLALNCRRCEDGCAYDMVQAVALAAAAAERKDPFGLYALGWQAYNGDGVARDRERGRALLGEAYKGLLPLAQAGDPRAQCNVAWLCAGGVGTASNATQAVAWSRKAADQQYARAIEYLGHFHEHGQGVERDVRKAAQFYMRAAKAGYLMAYVSLGDLLLHGKGVKHNAEKAVSCYRKAAEAGLPHGQHGLALAFADGQGMERDPGLAAYWYGKAVEQGYAESMLRLGLLHHYGHGASWNASEAVNLYRKAASLHHADAQYWLGIMYQTGYEVEKDVPRAMELYRQAAGGGVELGHYALGLLYDEGEDVAGDPAMAFSCYERAASNGVAGAMFEVGEAFEKGEGTVRDIEKAIAWYEKGVKAGCGRACAQLAWLCATAANPARRDGNRAINLMSHEDAEDIGVRRYYEIMAAAYARIGNFEEAVEQQSYLVNVLEWGVDEADEKRIQEDRLMLYRGDRPFTDTPDGT